MSHTFLSPEAQGPQSRTSLPAGTAAAWLPPLCRGAAYLTAALVLAPFLYHLAANSTAFLGLLEDDFFYYATIADHVVTQGQFSYDGVTVTNGFHPLWMVCLIALRALFGRFGPGFYLALTAVAFTAAVLCYEFGRQFARAMGATPVTAAVAAAAATLGTAKLFTTGMECILAAPLMLLLLREAARRPPVTPRRAAILGFLASLTILARLDLVLLVGLGLSAWIWSELRARRPLVARLAAFCAGGVLLPAYLVANVALFGSLLPVSAAAKQLYTLGFNPWYAMGVALTSAFGPAMVVLLPAGAVAAWLVLRRRGAASPARVVGALAIGFSFLLFGLNALSGWIFFGWYAYPLAAATIVSIVFLAESSAHRIPVVVTAAAAAIIVAAQPLMAAKYSVEHGPKWGVGDNSMLLMSYQLKERLQRVPGTIGMGAIGGVVGYVMDRPIVQLEGIVGDADMLEHIRREDSLSAVLREAGVDLLVVTRATPHVPMDDGCYVVTQPDEEWAGQRTAKMRGAICSEPLLRFTTPAGGHSWSFFPQLETFVWDLRTARWAPVPAP